MHAATRPRNESSRQKAHSLFFHLIALYLVPVIAAMAIFLADGEDLLGRFWTGFAFLAFVVTLIWSMPLLRGRSLGYPLQVISLIWFAVYGFGALTWANAGRDESIFIVYSAGFALTLLAGGYLCGMSLQRASPSQRVRLGLGGLRRRAWVFTGIASLATFVFIVKGGFPAFHPNALTYRFEVREQVSSYVVFLLRASQIPLYFYWATYQLKIIPKTRRNMTLVWLAIALVLFVNYIPGWRNPLMLIAFNLLFITVLADPAAKRVLPVILAATAAIGILVMGFLRLLKLSQNQTVGAISYFSQFTTDPFQMFLLWASVQFSNYTLGFLTALSIFPDVVDHLHGNVIVTTLATMMPGRQELLDEKLKRWSGMDFDGAGLNLTILGESYADFGILGIGLYPFIYGFALGWLVKRAERSPSPATVVVAAFAASSLALGSLTGLLSLSNFWILGAFLVFVAMGEKRRTHKKF